MILKFQINSAYYRECKKKDKKGVKMANSLVAFMAQNAVKVEVTNMAVSKRFLDGDGKPVMWELGPITSDEDEGLRRACTYKTQVTGKKDQFTMDFDNNRYIGVLAAKCVIYPDLNDVGLQDSYSVRSADSLLKTMLLPGEYAKLVEKVQEINGYDRSMDEVVEEAKN